MSFISNGEPKGRVIICGAGICGLATAIGLRRGGFQVLVLERMSEHREIGAGINIPPNATLIFKQWGLLERLESLAVEPVVARMKDWFTGETMSDHFLKNNVRNSSETPYLLVHRCDVHRILLEEAQSCGAEIRLNSTVIAVDMSEPSVSLEDGQVLGADLVLAADGERSLGRETLSPGSNAAFRSTGDHVYRMTVGVDKVQKHGLAHLVDPPALNLWVGPNGFATIYTVRKDHLLNIVLTANHPKDSQAVIGPRLCDMEEIQSAFAGWDRNLLYLFELAETLLEWTLFACPEQKQWVHREGRFALLGDAAHPMLPHLYACLPGQNHADRSRGQGAAMAIEDAMCLTTLLSKIGHLKQIPDVLWIFQQTRLPRASRMFEKARQNRDVFICENRERSLERDRQLREFRTKPFDGYPNFLADCGFREWMFSHDTQLEAEKAWQVYLKGEFPGTTGQQGLGKK